MDRWGDHGTGAGQGCGPGAPSAGGRPSPTSCPVPPGFLLCWGHRMVLERPCPLPPRAAPAAGPGDGSFSEPQSPRPYNGNQSPSLQGCCPCLPSRIFLTVLHNVLSLAPLPGLVLASRVDLLVGLWGVPGHVCKGPVHTSQELVLDGGVGAMEGKWGPGSPRPPPGLALTATCGRGTRCATAPRPARGGDPGVCSASRGLIRPSPEEAGNYSLVAGESGGGDSDTAPGAGWGLPCPSPDWACASWSSQPVSP